MTIGGVLFFLGVVVTANGAISVLRGQSMQRLGSADPNIARRAKRFRDLGTVTITCGVIVVLGSFLIIAKRGF